MLQAPMSVPLRLPITPMALITGLLGAVHWLANENVTLLPVPDDCTSAPTRHSAALVWEESLQFREPRNRNRMPVLVRWLALSR